MDVSDALARYAPFPSQPDNVGGKTPHRFTVAIPLLHSAIATQHQPSQAQIFLSIDPPLAYKSCITERPGKSGCHMHHTASAKGEMRLCWLSQSCHQAQPDGIQLGPGHEARVRKGTGRSRSRRHRAVSLVDFRAGRPPSRCVPSAETRAASWRPLREELRVTMHHLCASFDGRIVDTRNVPRF